MMTKRRVIPINEDGGLGKIISGEQYVREDFPELFEKPVDQGPVTSPINQPGPTGPPVVEETKPIPTIDRPLILAYEWKDLGKGRATGCPVYLIQFPEGPRIVEDYTTLGRWRLEKFGVCGFDLEIDLLPGVERPTGPPTGNYGMNTPADFACPVDCVEGNWPSGPDGKPGRKFFVWEKSKLNTVPNTPSPVITIEDGVENFGSVTETGKATHNGQSTSYIRTNQ